MDFVRISINLAVNVKLPGWRGDQIINLDSVCVDQSWQKLFKDRLGINDAFILKGCTHSVDEKLPIRMYYQQFKSQWNRYKISMLPAPIVPAPAKKSRSANNMSRKRKAETMTFQDDNRDIDNNSPPKLFRMSPLQDVKRYLELEAEQTRMGNNKVQNVRKFFADRISDADILTIRSELSDLKRRGNYIELIRMASFTAGFLESCFL